mmetsp:Transcript_53242/g.143565  ORF Transcript_53242/g.143565 Transcript_53242/m.143565 type:complete len:377 (-) Transcript_53242:185-1315(-)
MQGAYSDADDLDARHQRVEGHPHHVQQRAEGAQAATLPLFGGALAENKRLLDLDALALDDARRRIHVPHVELADGLTAAVRRLPQVDMAERQAVQTGHGQPEGEAGEAVAGCVQRLADLLDALVELLVQYLAAASEEELLSLVQVEGNGQLVNVAVDLQLRLRERHYQPHREQAHEEGRQEGEEPRAQHVVPTSCEGGPVDQRHAEEQQRQQLHRADNDLDISGTAQHLGEHAREQREQLLLGVLQEAEALGTAGHERLVILHLRPARQRVEIQTVALRRGQDAALHRVINETDREQRADADPSPGQKVCQRRNALGSDLPDLHALGAGGQLAPHEAVHVPGLQEAAQGHQQEAQPDRSARGGSPPELLRRIRATL